MKLLGTFITPLGNFFLYKVKRRYYDYQTQTYDVTIRTTIAPCDSLQTRLPPETISPRPWSLKAFNVTNDIKALT